jgi:SAM-dependent methyltransferase
MSTTFEISPDDTMYEGSLEHYRSVGKSALHCVKTAMVATNTPTFRSILDFGSGFGRVLREFKTEFPAARLTACDISMEAIEFCAKTFGATPVLSGENPADARFTDKFDLVWCGTVFTQFDSPQFLAFLGLLHSLLTQNGLLVFTTHGRFVAQRFRNGEGANYGMDESSTRAILDGWDGMGFGYADYPREVLARLGVTRYGVCVSKPSWICRQIEAVDDMKLVSYTERAWDNHQDSVACIKQ